MSQLRLVPVGYEADTIVLKGQSVSIGRNPDNTIRVNTDQASRYHCVIEPAPAESTDPAASQAYRVRDLGSRNGTKVNNIRVNEWRLSPGDTIRIGGREFTIESSGSSIVEEEEPARKPSEKARGRGWRGLREELTKSAEPDWAREMRILMAGLPPKDAEPEGVSLMDASGNPSTVLDAAESGEADGARAVKLMIQAASKSRATDIHVEPKVERHHVRMRVDGEMLPIVDLPLQVGTLVAGLIKTACQMHQTHKEAVQEGNFSAKFPDRRVDFRVSFTPSVHGQKLVLRVLDERYIPKSLAEIGMAPYMYQRVRRVCEQDHGLLLVCGPTGSGKTTTLYNVMREIDRRTSNVITIEDPVEYRVEGVTQIPIDEQRGNDFHSLLRSVLRQDPDVILVGEIRDEETAKTAMQASMTGHVVLSTIHAKDTIAAVFRLLDLKVEPYLVANSLDLVLAQRLVRVLCDTCKRPVPVSPAQATRMGRFLAGKSSIFTATGCAKCLRTGYRGRKAIFELLDVTNDLRDVILTEPTVAAIRRVIELAHFTTLVQSGWKLVADAETSLEEIDQVAGQG